MSIYTKTGDKGETSLVDGQRVSKCCARLESYGTIDELSAHIGLLATLGSEYVSLTAFTSRVQNDLFVCGAYLASSQGECPCIGEDAVKALESEIDRLESTLPKLHSFVLPGGCAAAAEAHVCRTVCRRAEREVLRLLRECTVDDTLLRYLNRLSDYFFVLARALNQASGTEEITWTAKKE
jgi:cob(I)alamin adenosyltransferase